MWFIPLIIAIVLLIILLKVKILWWLFCIGIALSIIWMIFWII